MHIFSRGSDSNHYRSGHSGSGRYRRRGILGELFGMSGSGSESYQRHSDHHPCGSAGENRNVRSDDWQFRNQGMTPCPACSALIPAGSRFCMQCGGKAR